MAAERVEWIRDGTVNALAYPRAAAAEFAAPVAVPGDNLLLAGGSEASLDDMIASTLVLNGRASEFKSNPVSPDNGKSFSA